jgi:plasmid stabilization system protein ParE
MPHLIWSLRAQQDLSRLYAFLAPRSNNAGRRALLTIREGVRLLQDHPNAGRAVPDGHGNREWAIPFGASGYLVIYRIDGEKVVILRVRHIRETKFGA